VVARAGAASMMGSINVRRVRARAEYLLREFMGKSLNCIRPL
jgi:hypothetical protein